MTSGLDKPQNRRHLAKSLTRIADATVSEILEMVGSVNSSPAWRIGISGPPGAGKSTLIAALAEARLGDLEAVHNSAVVQLMLAIVAIDPSSPISGGALLGDRVRMDSISSDPRVYVRSLASREGRDGLTDNISDLLACIDGYGFREVILETVGVGQAEHAARALVDTFVLVLHPDAGDTVQAMKSGIMEVPDIYVVNKADLPAAKRTIAELESTLKAGWRDRAFVWKPPILAVSREDADGLAKLNAAITAHKEVSGLHRNSQKVSVQRQRFHLQSLLRRHLNEVLDDNAAVIDPLTLQESFSTLLRLTAKCQKGV